MIGLDYMHAMLAGALGGAAPLTLTNSTRRPTGSDLRNPSDPVQAARIAAAVAKRERRATKYADSMSRAAFNNRAHGGIQFAHTLNPFYINY